MRCYCNFNWCHWFLPINKVEWCPTLNLFWVARIALKTFSNSSIHFIPKESTILIRSSRTTLFVTPMYVKRYSMLSSFRNHFISHPTNYGPYSMTEMQGMPYLDMVLRFGIGTPLLMPVYLILPIFRGNV